MHNKLCIITRRTVSVATWPTFVGVFGQDEFCLVKSVRLVVSVSTFCAYFCLIYTGPPNTCKKIAKKYGWEPSARALVQWITMQSKHFKCWNVLSDRAAAAVSETDYLVRPFGTCLPPKSTSCDGASEGKKNLNRPFISL